MGYVQSKFWAFTFISGVAVFSIILFFLLSAGDEQISATATPQISREGEVVVYVNNKGFNPENITVKSGTQVKWVNNGNRVHNVSFTLSSSLDNMGGINQNLGSGETLSYKFERPGQYAYFDRNNGNEGKVDVK